MREEGVKLHFAGQFEKLLLGREVDKHRLAIIQKLEDISERSFAGAVPQHQAAFGVPAHGAIFGCVILSIPGFPFAGDGSSLPAAEIVSRLAHAEDQNVAVLLVSEVLLHSPVGAVRIPDQDSALAGNQIVELFPNHRV